MSQPTHPLLILVERNANCLKSMLTHYIDATVDNQFASLKESIETMIQSGQIGPHPSHDVTAFGTTSPPPTQANTDQSSAQCSHEYSNDTLTRAQEHQNTRPNEVSMSNTNIIKSMIKQEFDDEENEMDQGEEDEIGEEIDDDNVAKCEKCENGICNSVRVNCEDTFGEDTETEDNGDGSFEIQQNVDSVLESHRMNQSISNDILPSPSPTNPINTEPLVKQECLLGSSITIPLKVNNNIALNDIATDELIEGQNTHIQTDEFDNNEEVDDNGYSEDSENEYLNNRNCEDCPNGVCDLDHENNNNHLNNDVPVGDKTDIETNLSKAQSQINVSVTNNTQMNIKNEENFINEGTVSVRNMEQSTSSNIGERSSTRKRIQTKVFGDLVQSNVNHRKCGKRKSDQLNKSVKKAKRKQILDDDEDNDSDKEEHTNNAIGEFATECTTNPIQPNLAQSNRHWQCSHCLKSFIHHSKFQRHLRVHTGERPFHCDQCGKRFSVKSSLTKHQLIHQNIKRFRCHECDKQFTQKPHLLAHLRIHSGDRPFECRHCDKSFADLDTRKKHEQAIHLHVKPYRCKQCGHNATQRSDVITHIRIVHFGLPKSIKEQRALNIIDKRDPRELVEKV